VVSGGSTPTFFVSTGDMDATSLERILEDRVDALGYELVELERAGSRSRPVLRVRIDRPDSRPGAGVTLEDCATVSRALEKLLDEDPGIAERYVLEVSSPGIERPLVRPRDYSRFAGEWVAVKSRTDVGQRGRRIQGRLIGLAGEHDQARVRISLDDGEIVDIPHADVVRAHLVFRWPDER
jgi:ribosome maturation factor RimP